MSLQSVKEHLEKFHRAQDILVFDKISATVEQAAEVLNVHPARIAKTLSFKDKEGNGLLIVTAGDAKIDNQKFRNQFNMKAKMLNADEVEEQTGHPVGGVCPFGLAKDLKVYLDQSLQRFSTVFPACGHDHSAIELTCHELEEYSSTIAWVDVSKGWDQDVSEAGTEEKTSISFY